MNIEVMGRPITYEELASHQERQERKTQQQCTEVMRALLTAGDWDETVSIHVTRERYAHERRNKIRKRASATISDSYTHNIKRVASREVMEGEDWLAHIQDCLQEVSLNGR